ncbi:MAG: 16S rRNA (uracil(1498)-N(3))-methyltransferase [Chamaesiphon sp.]
MFSLQRVAIAPTQIQNQHIALTPQQLHYLSRVLRLREGDRFLAMDGLGSVWLAQLVGTSAQIVERGDITSLIPPQTELPIDVTLMMALPKGNGFDEVVRYCTELGVYKIVPLVSDRTLLNPSPQKLSRWRRIAEEAAEQSERQIVPTILDPISYTTSLSLVSSHSSLNLICVARADAPHLSDCLLDKEIWAKEPGKSRVTIAIGPEGGWTPKEVEQASVHGLKIVSLGRRILRSVTAPVVALSLVAASFESVSKPSPLISSLS